MNASDLHPKHSDNNIDKYADDTYLVIVVSMVHTCEEELSNIEEWADLNNLRPNHHKSYEIVFKHPPNKNNESALPPPPLVGMERVDQLKILGVTVTNNFSMHAHINANLS